MNGNDTKTIELTVNIKDSVDPLTINVPPSLTPKEIIEDLQAQGEIQKLSDRTVTMTHGKTNLQASVPIDKQGIGDKATVSIVWDGKLAARLA